MTPNNEAKVTEHTPTPWIEVNEPGVCQVNDTNGKSICLTNAWNVATERSFDECHANAAFIVKAVNAHDALLAIAKKWRDEIMDDAPDDLGVFQIEILKEIEQAVALAEGRPE